MVGRPAGARPRFPRARSHPMPACPRADPLGFEDGHRDAAPCELPRHGEPGESGTDDGDVDPCREWNVRDRDVDPPGCATPRLGHAITLTDAPGRR